MTREQSQKRVHFAMDSGLDFELDASGFIPRRLKDEPEWDLG